MKSNWSQLKPLQLGRYAEYLVKMEFALHGFDIYGAEVDDKGIDFLIRLEVAGEPKYYDVQVKSIRGFNYIFFPKDKFKPAPTLLATVVMFIPNEAPHIYLIPSMAWLHPDALLKERLFKGKKSKPEWGLNLSKKNQLLLKQYRFDRQVERL